MRHVTFTQRPSTFVRPSCHRVVANHLFGRPPTFPSTMTTTRRRCLSFCTLFVFERSCHGDSSLSRLWIDSGIKEDASRDVAGPTWLHYVLYMYVHLSASEVRRRKTRNGEALVINTINKKTLREIANLERRKFKVVFSDEFFV